MALIIQWVRINFGFSAAGGKLEEPTEASCELLLIAVPTPPRSDNTRPPWQTDDISFADLMQFAMDDAKPALTTSTDAIVDDLARTVQEVNNVPAPLLGIPLEKAMAAAEKFTSGAITSFEQAAEVMPSPPFAKDPPADLRGDPSQIAPAKMYAMELSASDVAYFTGNTATRVEIVLASGEQELEGWRMFRVMADEKFNQWQEQINRLKALRNLLRNQRKEGEAYVDNAREKHQELAQLEQETAPVRHYRWASETLGGRHQHGMNTFPPTYLSGRGMQHMSPGQGSYLGSPSGPGQYPMYYPTAAQGNA